MMTALTLLFLSILSFPAENKIWGKAKTDQERCQAEADYMAKHNIKGHVGPCIGSFEGCGWGFGGNPPTCSPRRIMRLTGDATAKSKYGVFRVRSWR